MKKILFVNLYYCIYKKRGIKQFCLSFLRRTKRVIIFLGFANLRHISGVGKIINYLVNFLFRAIFCIKVAIWFCLSKKVVKDIIFNHLAMIAYCQFLRTHFKSSFRAWSIFSKRWLSRWKLITLMTFRNYFIFGVNTQVNTCIWRVMLTHIYIFSR